MIAFALSTSCSVQRGFRMMRSGWLMAFISTATVDILHEREEIITRPSSQTQIFSAVPSVCRYLTSSPTSTPSTCAILGLSTCCPPLNRLFCSFFSAYRGKIAKDTKAYCVYIQLLNVHCCPPPLAAGATPATHKPLHRLLHPRIQAISPNLRRSWPGCGRRWTKFVLVCTEGTKKFWPLYRRYCSHFCK